MQDRTPGARSRAGYQAGRSAREVSASPEFRRLVSRRWAVSLTLLALLCLTYYGYVLLVSLAPGLVSARLGRVTTLAIPLGVGVIVIAFVLTAVYVGWANATYDPEVERLKRQIRK